MRGRSNMLVLVGLVAFVLGLAAVYVVTKDDDGGGTALGPDSVEVLVAGQDLASGALGDDVVAGNQYRVERINRADLLTDAVTTPSQLSGQILTLNFAEGEQLRISGLRPQSPLSQIAEIPDGFEAVAVGVDFIAGGAGYIAPGDRVNVFLVVPAASQLSLAPGGAEAVAGEVTQFLPPYAVSRTELLLTNITVLDVSQQVDPLRGSEPTTTDSAGRLVGDRLTVLLAVATHDAEKVIYGSTALGNQLYLSLVRDDATPAAPTAGIDYLTILVEEAQDAFNRSNP